VNGIWRGPVARLLSRRILLGILTLFLVSLVVFAATQVLPGDAARAVLGREATSVSFEAWNPAWSGFKGPPVAVGTIVFDGDLVVSYRGSWISAGAKTPYGGEWRMDFEAGEVRWTSRGEDSSLADLVLMRARGGESKELALPRLRRVDRWGTLSEFAAAVRGRRQPESSGRYNLGSLALMSAAVESATRREPVRVPPFRLSRAAS
jgi:hypothetical protein